MLKKETKGIFNHTHVFTGYQGGLPYLRPERGAVDNINRHHVNIYGICDICDKKILLAHMHVDASTDKIRFHNDKEIPKQEYREDEVLSLMTRFAAYTLLNADEDSRMSIDEWFKENKP